MVLSRVQNKNYHLPMQELEASSRDSAYSEVIMYISSLNRLIKIKMKPLHLEFKIISEPTCLSAMELSHFSKHEPTIGSVNKQIIDK